MIICLESYRRQRDLETSEEHSIDDIRVSIPEDMEFDSHVSFNAKTKEIIDLS